MCLNVGVYHNQDIDIVRRRSERWVYGESNLICKRILFRILDIFHPFGQDDVWYESPNSQPDRKSFRNGGTWGFRRDGRDELWDGDGANAQFYILYRNLVLDIDTIVLRINFNFFKKIKGYKIRTYLHEFFDGDIIQRMIEMSIHIVRIVKLVELDFELLKICFIITVFAKKRFFKLF